VNAWQALYHAVEWALPEAALTRSHHDVSVTRFTAEAPAFARSPLHLDPVRLQQLVACTAPGAGERGLDVACGPGIVATALAAAGAGMTAVDLTPEMLRQFPASIALRACAEATRLPFAAGTFDFVVCRNALHHFPDPGAAIVEFARVLRSGGRLVIEDMIAAEDLRERDAQETIERLRDPAHARTLPRSEILAQAGAAGLRIESEQARPLRIDFDEWIDRPAPEPAARERARRLMERRLGAQEGVRAFLVDGRLFFERPGILLRTARP
jgi:SAM-dependent methyltransferase